MSRKDGKHILFKDFFGPKLYQPAQSNTLTPKIQMVLVDLTAVEMVETIFLVQVGVLVMFVLEELRKRIVF